MTDTSVDLAWSRSGADHGSRVTYDIYKDGRQYASVTDSVYSSVTEIVYTVQGLAPDTEYRFYVVARDESGAASAPSEELRVRTETNLTVIRQLIEQYAASGELNGPFARQLANQGLQSLRAAGWAPLEIARRIRYNFSQTLSGQKHIFPWRHILLT